MHDAARTTSIPTLKRKIAVAAAIESARAGTSTLEKTGASNAKPNPCTGMVCLNSVCSANQIDRLRMTPTTAAVMAVSAPASDLLPRSFFDVRRAEEDPQEARRKRHPGGKQAAEGRCDQRRKVRQHRGTPAMNPTNWTTMMRGPGVVSAMPKPSSISRGWTQW